MGDVLELPERRAEAPGRSRVTFFFDLADPTTYLAAERVERLLTGVSWTPADGSALGPVPVPDRAALEERADLLRVPLVWPDRAAGPVRPAMRAACFAAEQRRAAPFVLAATRLAFCGGYDLDHPEVLAEAAGAAGLSLGGTLHAAGDVARDAAMVAASRELAAQGADALPVVRVGRDLFCGEHRIGDAADALRASRIGRTA